MRMYRLEESIVFFLFQTNVSNHKSAHFSRGNAVSDNSKSTQTSADADVNDEQEQRETPGTKELIRQLRKTLY